MEDPTETEGIPRETISNSWAKEVEDEENESLLTCPELFQPHTQPPTSLIPTTQPTPTLEAPRQTPGRQAPNSNLLHTPSVLERAVMFDNSNSNQHPPLSTSMLDLITTIRTVNQELVTEMRSELLDGLNKETKSLSTQISKYHQELQENTRRITEHQARIVNLEKQVTNLQTLNRSNTNKLTSLKESSKQTESKLKACQKKVKTIRETK